jgi:peptidoglycan hydrolase-like protein with peptidoglycan-binding domain
MTEIPDPISRLWTDRPNPNWKLGGIYADKPGYHNTVKANQQKWPGNYSIKLDLDIKHDNLYFARAIDVTMSDAEMVKWTSRMKTSALDSNDHRLAAVREFYGTLDNKTVFGLIKDDEDGPWRHSSANSTHLWHGHMSIFTAYANSWKMLEPVLSVWAGETPEEWGNTMSFPAKGETSEDVRYWQFRHNNVRSTVTPPSPLITVDNDYGPATVAAFTDFAKKNGAAADYVANKITAWLASKYDIAMVKTYAPKQVIPPPVSDQLIKDTVNAWLTARFTTSALEINGSIKGFVSL